MSVKPNIHDVLEHTCRHFGLTMAEALAITKTPLHPRELRDEFAKEAMSIMWDAYDKGYCGVIEPDTFDNSALARGAYHLADEMLKARTA